MKNLDDWERMPSRCIPASSWLRVVREKQEANAREVEEEAAAIKRLKLQAKRQREAEEGLEDE